MSPLGLLGISDVGSEVRSPRLQCCRANPATQDLPHLIVHLVSVLDNMYSLCMCCQEYISLLSCMIWCTGPYTSLPQTLHGLRLGSAVAFLTRECKVAPVCIHCHYRMTKFAYTSLPTKVTLHRDRCMSLVSIPHQEGASAAKQWR